MNNPLWELLKSPKIAFALTFTLAKEQFANKLQYTQYVNLYIYIYVEICISIYYIIFILRHEKIRNKENDIFIQYWEYSLQ